MKRKDLMKEIEIKAMNDFKDINIDISNIEIEEPIESTRNIFSLRRAVSLTFASIFILVTGFFIYNLNIGDTFSNVTPLNSETEILGFQTVSSAALLSSYEVSDLSHTDEIIEPIELSQNAFNITDELSMLADYMNLAETMFGSSNNYVYNEVESDDSDYQYKFIYKGMDLAGNLIEYIGYYNKSTNDLGVEVTDGILINNQRTYSFTQFIGLSLSKYTIYTNQYNYVEVINMSTESSQSFRYNIYKGNQLFNSSVINISQFQQDFEAEIIITNTNNKELKLNVSNQNNFQGFTVKYNYDDKQSGTFDVLLTYDNESEMYQYQFQFGESSFVTNRIDKGNKKANDDDFINWQNNTDDETNDDDDTRPGNRRNKSTNNPSVTTYLLL